jgi:hypothetical protein
MRQTSRFIFRRIGSLLVLLGLLLLLLLLLLLIEVELLSPSSSSSSTTFLSRVDVHMWEGRDRMSV